MVTHGLITQHETKWSEDQIQLLKNTVCKGATDDEFKIFCYAVQRTGLDPFMKQIHAVKRWNAKANREHMSIQVGIDGYRLIADRTGLYAGNEDALFDNEQQPTRATVTVYKMVQGQRCAFSATARWSEYYPGDQQGFMWKKMPCVMLGKVAEALALRKAFPAELSGVYTDEEMAQADKSVPVAPAIEIVPKDLEEKKKEGQRIKALKQELLIEDADLKAQAFKLCGKDDFKLMNVEDLKKITHSLEEEKSAREKAFPTIPEIDQTWLKEIP